MRGAFSRILICMACLPAAFSIGVPAILAQSVEDVFPVEPQDGAVVGHRPKFKLGVEGSDIRKMSFRIELSRNGFRTVDYTFDQLENRNGWAYIGFDQPGALFLVPGPLEGGIYEWKTYAWDGLAWIEGDKVHGLIVDTVPPADVEWLRLSLDRKKEVVILDWLPVATDQEGAPEFVTCYHVYRHHNPNFSPIRVHEAARMENTSYREGDLEKGPKLIFYKITAEDVAGNQPKRRRPALRAP